MTDMHASHFFKGVTGMCIYYIQKKNHALCRVDITLDKVCSMSIAGGAGLAAMLPCIPARQISVHFQLYLNRVIG